MKLRTLLVATDLSERADVGLKLAHEWATALAARLVVCHVLPPMTTRSAPPLLASLPPAVTQLPVLMEKVAAAVERQVRAATGRAPEAYELQVMEGEPHQAILQLAERLSADLITLSSSGRSAIGEWLLGSTAEEVARGAHCAVLVARPSPRSSRMLVASDGSENAQRAVRSSAEVAKALHGELSLLEVLYLEEPLALRLGLLAGGPVPTPRPQEREAFFRMVREPLEQLHAGLGLRGEVLLAEGRPASTICRVAQEHSAEWVAVGRMGATGLQKLLLGRVATKVLRSSPCSVLVVP